MVKAPIVEPKIGVGSVVSICVDASIPMIDAINENRRTTNIPTSKHALRNLHTSENT